MGLNNFPHLALDFPSHSQLNQSVQQVQTFFLLFHFSSPLPEPTSTRMQDYIITVGAPVSRVTPETSFRQQDFLLAAQKAGHCKTNG